MAVISVRFYGGPEDPSTGFRNQIVRALMWVVRYIQVKCEGAKLESG